MKFGRGIFFFFNIKVSLFSLFPPPSQRPLADPPLAQWGQDFSNLGDLVGQFLAMG